MMIVTSVPIIAALIALGLRLERVSRTRVAAILLASQPQRYGHSRGAFDLFWLLPACAIPTFYAIYIHDSAHALATRRAPRSGGSGDPRIARSRARRLVHLARRWDRPRYRFLVPCTGGSNPPALASLSTQLVLRFVT